MSLKKRVKATNDEVFRHPALQAMLRNMAHHGMLPEAVYSRIRPAGTHPVTTPAGNTVSYFAGRNDAMARYVVWPSGWERSSLRLFSALASGAELVLDIGAYSGIYTLVAGADSTSKIIAVEPNPDIVVNLERNVEINRFCDRVEVLRAAVSRHSGNALLRVPDLDPTSAFLTQHQDAQIHDGTYLVPVTTIDVLATNKRVGVIKLDVEGHEEDALLGGEHTIRSQRPHLIVELLNASSFHVVVDLLQAWGYQRVMHMGARRMVEVADYVYEPYAANFYFPSPEGLGAWHIRSELLA